MGGKLVVEHGQLHHRLVVNKGQLQLAQLDAQRFDGAEARDDKWEDNQTVGHEKRQTAEISSEKSPFDRKPQQSGKDNTSGI